MPLQPKPLQFSRILVILLPLLLLLPPLSINAFAKAQINCEIQKHSCTRQMGERTVELDITPRPVEAMKELTFRVTISGRAPAEPPFIDLGMPAMEMGPNRVKMEKVDDGVYEGTGIIVKCPSGKTIWEAVVTVPGAGKAGFIFDVVY